MWLDEDLDDTPGLHADIKLSKGGEMALLVDTDGITVLDHVVFGEQETDVSYGRLPNGTGEFQVVDATPGAENRTHNRIHILCCFRRDFQAGIPPEATTF